MSDTNETQSTVVVNAEVVAPKAPKGDEAGSLADTLFDVVTAWAAYGLESGTRALEESASTLEKTARFLAKLSKEIAPERRARGDEAA